MSKDENKTNDGSFSEIQFQMFLKLTTLQQDFVVMKMVGMNDIDAYICAGGSAVTENAQRTSASEIMMNHAVKALMNLIQKDKWEAAIMSREEMGARLTGLASTTIGDILDIETETRMMMDMETGEIEEIAGQTRWSLKAIEDMTGAGLAAISELSIGKDGYKIKTHSTMTAKKQLSDLMGYNKPQEILVATPKDWNDFYGDT